MQRDLFDGKQEISIERSDIEELLTYPMTLVPTVTCS